MYLELLKVLEESKEVVYTSGWYVGMTILLCVLITPWIYVIFKFGVFRRLRVRFIFDDGTELAPIYVKKGMNFDLPEAPQKEGYEFVGWFVDPEFSTLYEKDVMPDNNMKLFGKYVKQETPNE